MSSLAERLRRAQAHLAPWFYTRPRVRNLASRHFHRAYFYTGLWGGTWNETDWLGTRIGKCPLDLWLYLEVLTTVKPNLIIETGTFAGGSALWFASMAELHGIDAEIVTVDIEDRDGRPQHDRVTYLSGSSTALKVVEAVRDRATGKERIVVVLDSDHRAQHVSAELEAYADLVTPGSYLIVEDTDLSGHPVAPWFRPGPMEAVERFLASDDRFVIDTELERRQLMTLHPNGWLRRLT